MAVLVAVAACLGGCATGAARVRRMGTLPAQPDTAMSAEVRDAATRPTTYPKFTDIPPVPDDVRPLRGWDQAVGAVRRDEAQLKAELASAPPPPTDTAAFAARATAEVAPPPSPDQVGATDAFAAKAREAAKPPLKPK